ncbi:MAG: TIGR04168 family protein [Planctomycetota bacterium]|nr:TIGR04168 family protein [Planctomycetota bacterium]MEC8652966.1 TIGR04168 family protein [Planctomycetota bacterium]MEC9047430.1 TIGR04168 family protein [Planctomycetota bacterium]
MADRTTPSPATLVAIGDIHRCWREVDSVYLERTQPDLTLFVGDLGDELRAHDEGAVEATVAKIASINVPKAVILGNHDAWRSVGEKQLSDALNSSLDALGGDHVAYDVREVPSAGVSVVGARPFSWGGQSLRSPELYDELYGVRTMRQSAAAIVEAARGAQHRDLVVLAHNGPTGLGAQPGDIYGKDFGKPGGDWGDHDLALALQRIEGLGLRVRAVIAGHMHHVLLHPRGAERTRFVRRGDTLFINCAVVPRVVRDAHGEELSYFVRMRWAQGECQSLEEVWVDTHGDEKSVNTPSIEELAGPAPAVDESGAR